MKINIIQKDSKPTIKETFPAPGKLLHLGEVGLVHLLSLDVGVEEHLLQDVHRKHTLESSFFLQASLASPHPSFSWLAVLGSWQTHRWHTFGWLSRTLCPLWYQDLKLATPG